MIINGNKLHRGNLGQIVGMDYLDSRGDEVHVVGILNAIERTADGVTLTIGAERYELDPEDVVDIVRSPALVEAAHANESIQVLRTALAELAEAVAA